MNIVDLRRRLKAFYPKMGEIEFTETVLYVSRRTWNRMARGEAIPCILQIGRWIDLLSKHDPHAPRTIVIADRPITFPRVRADRRSPR